MKIAAACIAALCGTMASASCDDAATRFSENLASAELPALIAQAHDLANAGCPAPTVTAALRQTASVAARRAMQAPGRAEALALLEQAPVSHWEVTAVRGTLLAQEGAHGEAAQAFNLALDRLGAPDLTEQTPDLEPAAQRLMQLAQEQMLLAETTETSLRSDGSASGLFKALGDSLAATEDQPYNIVRSAASGMTSVALPVRFKTGSAELDDAGEREARGLALYLRSLPGDVRLRITGHTDEVGAEAFNMELSWARAEALSAYLKKRGLSSQIELVGMGETEPPRMFSPESYSLEQRRSLARRVEVSFELLQ